MTAALGNLSRTVVLAAAVVALSATSAFAQSPTPASPMCSGAGECLCDNSFEDCRAPLIRLIQNEQVGIDVSLWFMTDSQIVSALVGRARARIPIRLIVDTEADVSYAGNQNARNLLAAEGIPIRDKVSSGINHWKAMIFAGQNKVMFSAANFANGSFSPAVTPYREYVDEAIYFTDDPDIVHSFMRKFDDHWVDTTNFRNLVNVTTLSRNFPTYAVHPDMNFVPDQHFENRLQAQLRYETQGADAVIFRITSAKIPDELIRLHQAGRRVRVISEELEYRNKGKMWHAYNIDRMYVAGIPIKIKDNITEQDVHQKSIILYNRALAPANAGPMVVFGSSNWTTSSSNSQREHNYFTTKPWMVQWFVDQFERKWNNTKVDGTPIGFNVYIPMTPLPPEAPVYVSPVADALGVATTVALKWEGGYWAHKYDIYVDTDPRFPAPAVVADFLTPHATAGPQSTKESYTITGLQPGVTYYWRVVSKTMANVAKVGPTWKFTTAGGVAAPPAPTGLTGTAASSARVDLAWSDVTGEEGYKVERKPASSSTWTQIAITAADAASYVDANNGLSPGASYNYRVRAFTSGGNSAYSNIVTVTTPSPQVNAADVVLYAAEAPVVSGRWSVTADATAANGLRLGNPNDGATRTNTALATPTNYFEMDFTAAAGRPYRLWMRGRATNDNKYNDSVHVQFSDSLNAAGAIAYRIGTTSSLVVDLEECIDCPLKGWGWQDTASGVNVLGPLVYFAESGTHRLRVQIREDGAAFDQIVLSPGTYLNAAPGAARQDSIILPKQGGSDPGPVDTQAPFVTLTSPSDGTTVGGTVAVLTQSSDDVAVTQVELWVDGARALTSTSHPFTFSWDTASVLDGPHTLQARASDATGNTASSDVVSVNVSNSVAATNEVVLYAAQATVISGSWAVVPEPTAAGGALLAQADAGAAKIAAPLAAPQHYFELTFNAEANTPYRLWIRGRAERNYWGNDSVHVQFSGSVDQHGAAVFRIDSTSATEVNLEDASGAGLSGWGWQDNGWGTGVLGPLIYFDTSGPQRIRIQTREDGFQIDQIVLSPSRYLGASPGALKNDTTIVPQR